MAVSEVLTLSVGADRAASLSGAYTKVVRIQRSTNKKVRYTFTKGCRGFAPRVKVGVRIPLRLGRTERALHYITVAILAQGTNRGDALCAALFSRRGVRIRNTLFSQTQIGRPRDMPFWRHLACPGNLRKSGAIWHVSELTQVWRHLACLGTYVAPSGMSRNLRKSGAIWHVPELT